MTLADALEGATLRLALTLGLERREARLEARVLAARAINVTQAWLVGHGKDDLSPAHAACLDALVVRREAGEPVAYILGEREFHGHLFQVTPDVLIPRPDTELLVETALERGPAKGSARVLDLGTGSGCIAISIALARKDWEVCAVDRSLAALDVAMKNARRLGAQVQFQESDWFAGLSVPPFDIIVSNPPYVEISDHHLSQGDVRFEPMSALVGGKDGLDDLRHLIAMAPDHLADHGWLLVEHGHEQGEACQMLFNQHHFRNVDTLADLAGHNRVTLGCKPFS